METSSVVVFASLTSFVVGRSIEDKGALVMQVVGMSHKGLVGRPIETSDEMRGCVFVRWAVLNPESLLREVSLEFGRQVELMSKLSPSRVEIVQFF